MRLKNKKFHFKNKKIVEHIFNKKTLPNIERVFLLSKKYY